jgi:hypothetical protein
MWEYVDCIQSWPEALPIETKKFHVNSKQTWVSQEAQINFSA